jgi:hypothetical protein
MMKKALLGLVIGVLAIGCQQKADEQQVKTPDTGKATQQARTPAPKPAMKQSDARIWVDAFTAERGAAGSFKVSYYGVEEAKAIVVPLTFPIGMAVDSISFAGGMLEYIATRPTRVENESNMLLFTAIPTTEPLIPAAEGVLATIHFTLAADAQSGLVDEVFVPPANYLAYVDTASVQVEPMFEPGQMTVK